MTDSPEQTPHTASSEPEREYREPEDLTPPAPSMPCECEGPCRHASVPPTGRTLTNLAREHRTIT